MTNLIRILVADDHTVVRRGLCSLLIPRNGMEVVGEAVDGFEAVALAQQLLPDVILMDLVMPHKDGVTAIREIKKHNAKARILVLTSFGDIDQVSQAMETGALGFLLKDSSPDQLFQAIRNVASGMLSLPRNLALQLLNTTPGPQQDHEVSEPSLTGRELDVLKGIARGLSNRQIAQELSPPAGGVRGGQNPKCQQNLKNLRLCSLEPLR